MRGVSSNYAPTGKDRVSKPFATIILAAGQGTRMGSINRPKVCCEMLRTPVIVRALETYDACGSALNIVVVGHQAERVMTVAGNRFPDVAFAFQEKQLGTGDAARKGALVLERLGFDGDVLVVAGDKVATRGAIRQLLSTHARKRADVTLATTQRQANSSNGIVLESNRGEILGILEEAERRRLVALGKLGGLFENQSLVSRKQADAIVMAECGEKAGRALLSELRMLEAADGSLRRASFERRFSLDQRRGLVRTGDRTLPAASVLEFFHQANLSTYVFRARVLLEALDRLRSRRPNQEEYLTDVIEILARRRPPARLVVCEIRNPSDLMAFNNPKELKQIEKAWRSSENSRPGRRAA